MAFGVGFAPSGSLADLLPSERMSMQGPELSCCSASTCPRVVVAVAGSKYLAKEMGDLAVGAMESPKWCQERAIYPLRDPKTGVIFLVSFLFSS